MLTHCLACGRLFFNRCVQDSRDVSACPQNKAHIEVLVSEHVCRVDVIHLLILVVLVMLLGVGVLAELGRGMMLSCLMLEVD